MDEDEDDKHASAFGKADLLPVAAADKSSVEGETLPSTTSDVETLPCLEAALGVDDPLLKPEVASRPPPEAPPEEWTNLM